MDRPLILAGRSVFTSFMQPIYAPWDQRELCRVAQAGPEELEAATAAAANALATTRALPTWRRIQILRAVQEGLARRAVELEAAIRDEAGKPIQLARIEVARARDTFEACIVEASKLGGDLLPLDASAAGAGRLGLTRRVPRGVLLAIAPFNFPLNLVCHKVGPAIAAGCPIVLKPAEQTPTAALILGEILVEAGWPAEAISVLPCDRAVAGKLVGDPRFAVISFTGSDRVGWKIKAEAGRAHVALELGGNAAVVVEPDADLDAAVARITAGAFGYAGQTCISVQRIFLHVDIYAEMRAKLVAAAQAVPCGDPADPAVVCGPLIDARNVARVTAWIAQAEAQGGRRLCGGEVRGPIVTPALLENVANTSHLCCDEVFGPVAILEPYAHFEDALSQINQSRFGLQAGVYTRDINKVFQAFSTLEVGAVIHNDIPTFRVDAMPYGGSKDSGIGREGPRYAMQDMTEERLLVVRV